MSASTLPFSRIRLGPPSSLYGIDVAESRHHRSFGVRYPAIACLRTQVT